MQSLRLLSSCPDSSKSAASTQGMPNDGFLQNHIPETFGSSSAHGSKPDWQWPSGSLDQNNSQHSLFLEPRHFSELEPLQSDGLRTMRSGQQGKGSLESNLLRRTSRHLLSDLMLTGELFEVCHAPHRISHVL